MRRPSLTGLRAGALAVALLSFAAVGAAACDALADAPALTVAVGTAGGDENAFQPVAIYAPPRTRIAVSFENRSNLEHNLVFVSPLEARSAQIVAPRTSDRIEFVTPEVGVYRFVCTIHEGMEGTLAVQ